MTANSLSFTAWKKLIKPGVHVSIDNRHYPNMNRVKPVLKVVPSRGFTAEYIRPDGERVESWITWPNTASEVVMDGQTCQFLDFDGITVRMALTIVEAAS